MTFSCFSLERTHDRIFGPPWSRSVFYWESSRCEAPVWISTAHREKIDFRIDRPWRNPGVERNRRRVEFLRDPVALESFVVLFSFGLSQHEEVLTINNNISFANLTAVTVGGFRFWVVLDSL